MNVKDLSKEDRPRERLIKVGPRALSDVELLAILIGSGTKTSTVLELATEILKQYTLVDLKDLTYEKINKIKGIKQAKACQLLVCFEIARRSSQIPKYRGSLETAKDIYEYIYDEIYLESSEIILAILCDCKLHPIKKIVIRGDEAHQVNFPTKKIITHALNIKAYAIILVHNHPSGDIHPSKIDIKATLDFQQLLNTLDILLLEHLVVSPSAYFSMHEHGLLSMNGEYSIMGDCFEKIFL